MARLFLLFCLCSAAGSAAELDFVKELGNIYATRIATGGDGSIWVAGYLYEGGPLRTTPDAFQPRPPDISCFSGAPRGPFFRCTIGFLAQLDGDGRVLYSTYLGGSPWPLSEAVSGLTADAEGHAYVSGAVGTMKFKPSGDRVEWQLLNHAYTLLNVAPDGGVVGVGPAGLETPLIGPPDATLHPVARYDGGDAWVSASFIGRSAVSGDGSLLGWTGERLLRSSDFGVTWLPVANPLSTVAERENVVTALHPDNANVALAGAAMGRMFRTEDAGATWTASTGIPEDFETYQVALASGGRAYATGFHRIEGFRFPLYFRSQDGGASWAPMEDPESAGLSRVFYFEDLATDPRSADTLFGIATFQAPAEAPYHAVLRTDDAGRSWSVLRADLRWASTIAVDPIDSNVLYLIASNGIEVSRNRGRTWSLAVSLVLGGSDKVLAIERTSGAVFAATEKGLYRSDDKGRTWALFEPEPPGQIRLLLAAPGAEAGDVRLLGSATYPQYPSRNAVTKIAADGSGVEWSFAIGGSGADWISGLAVDADGAVWLTGYTRSADFPRVGTQGAPYPGGETNAFLAKLDPIRGELEFSTVFGGSGADSADALFLDDSGEILVLGATSSADFPFTNAWLDGPENLSRRYLARFHPAVRGFVSIEPSNLPTGLLLRDSQGRFISFGEQIVRSESNDLSGPSVQLQGGQVQSAALDPEGRVILALTAQTADFGIVGDPRQKRILEQTAVVTALDFDRESGAPKITGVENGAGFFDGPIAPGEILTLRGRWFASEPHVFQTGEDGAISARLAGVSASFDGLSGTPLFVSPTQVNVVAPYDLAVGSTAAIRVVTQFGESAPVARRVVESAPALFTNGSSGAVVALDAELREVSLENPAERGAAVALFATGLGRLDAESPIDRLVPGVLPLPAPVLPVLVEIGGFVVEPEWIGASPTRPAGVVQVNVRVPADLAAGLETPIRLLVGGAPTQPRTSIPVQ